MSPRFLKRFLKKFLKPVLVRRKVAFPRHEPATHFVHSWAR
jgi:hypothetical protein